MVLDSSQTAAYRSITTSIALQGRWTPARPSAPVVLIIAKISPQGPNQTNPTPPSEPQGPNWSDHMLTVLPSVPYRSRTRERGCVQIGWSSAISPGFFLRSRFPSTAACVPCPLLSNKINTCKNAKTSENEHVTSHPFAHFLSCHSMSCHSMPCHGCRARRCRRYYNTHFVPLPLLCPRPCPCPRPCLPAKKAKAAALLLLLPRRIGRAVPAPPADGRPPAPGGTPPPARYRHRYWYWCEAQHGRRRVRAPAAGRSGSTRTRTRTRSWRGGHDDDDESSVRRGGIARYRRCM